MEIKLSTGNYAKPSLQLPVERLVNAYVESTPAGPSEDIRTARPGLTKIYSFGTSPILAMYQVPGLFNGDLFTICGESVYRNNNLIGTVAFSQTPQIAAISGKMAIVSGGGLYIYDGTTFTQQQYFDDGVSRLVPFSGVTVLYNIFIYPVVGSNQFFFSNVGEPGIINAANESLVQVSPDDIVQSFVLAEIVYFFKNRTTELWQFTGNLTAPFQEIQGATYARGCVSQGSVVKADNALFWIGDDLQVYRSSTVPERISTSFIEDRLHSETQPQNISAFTVNVLGHIFYVINLVGLNESWAYDCQTKTWAQWGTQQRAQEIPGIFQCSLAVGQGNFIFGGSYNDGRVFKFDTTNHTDDGVPVQVIVSGNVLTSGGYNKCFNVSLHNVRGVGTIATPNPVIKMRYSDDGRTWTTWYPASYGTIASYRYKTTWRNLGLIRQPGRWFEFSISDAVNITVEGLSLNEPRV